MIRYGMSFSGGDLVRFPMNKPKLKKIQYKIIFLEKLYNWFS